MDNISEQTTGRSTSKSKEGQEEITEIRYRTLQRKQNLLQLVRKTKQKGYEIPRILSEKKQRPRELYFKPERASLT